jgi:protein-disulfide isomerase
MQRALKPLIVIVVAIVIAAGAALYLSRTADRTAEASDKSSRVDIKSGGHIRGPANAQVTLVEFGDFQCPSCGGYHPLVKEILNRYPDKVRLEFHHYPLVDLHPNAMLGAMAAEAAGDQGRYWEMHDALFEHQAEWAPSRNAELVLLNLANRLGLNLNQFMQQLRSPALQGRILQDVTLGNSLHIMETPTFFIDGQRVYIKPTIEDFVKVVEAHLHK